MNELIGEDTKTFKKAVLLYDEMHKTAKKELDEDAIFTIVILSAILGGISCYFVTQIIMIDGLVVFAISALLSILMFGYLWTRKTRNLKKELDKLRSDFVSAYETSLESNEEAFQAKGIPNKERIEKVYLFFLKDGKIGK